MLPYVDIAIAAIFALFLIVLLGRAIFTPLRWFFKLLINSAVGLFLLLLVNFVGSPFGFGLPINLVSVLVAGFLGLPGVLLLLVLSFLR
ncbi:MAG: pro-sigmaK processing inhibitor BofA [Syntrophomonadaceae bacterium]|jgi:inhibitor of the pro-sigma K processing machinery|nr:pro-sigmaK processing inhibitor BofA [Syntrophomonadaceae bacterium]